MEFEIYERSFFLPASYLDLFIHYCTVFIVVFLIFDLYVLLVVFLRFVHISNLAHHFLISKAALDPNRYSEHLYSEDFNMILVGMVIFHALFLASYKLTQRGESLFFIYTALAVIRIVQYLCESGKFAIATKIIEHRAGIPQWQELLKKYQPFLVPKSAQDSAE